MIRTPSRSNISRAADSNCSRSEASLTEANCNARSGSSQRFRHCSVGSYTHGFITIEEAAAGQDTAALVGSGWVTEHDLHQAPAVASAPAAISYEPLEEAEDADVVLVRLTASSLMSLQGACPELSVVTKPQCQIVPLALEGGIAVSPGCAVSRVRTGLPSDELICAFPARELAGILARLERSLAADAAVSAYADADLHQNFTPA